MGVIVDLRIPAHQFEFGRRFPLQHDEVTEIERMGSVGDGDVSVFSFSGSFGDPSDGGVGDSFADVEGCRVEVLEVFGDETVYAMRWDPAVDPFFRLLDDHDGVVRRGTGTSDAWVFETCFPTQGAFAGFRSACTDGAFGAEVDRVYCPTRRGTGAWYGLTRRQHRTLELAVERGYYDIPRRCTTLELADELGISDQAVTERLRRGIVTFVTNALLLDHDE